MPDYTFTAVARDGTRSNGKLSAPSERDALSQLDSRGLFPLEIATVEVAGGRSIPFFGGVSGRQLSTFYSQLADLIHSGVPLLRSLELLERQSSSATLGSVLREVRAKVSDGKSLADAMAEHPQVFNDLVVSMVRAGQEGGFLEDVLSRTAVFVEHQEDMKTKVIGALAYPAFLVIAGGFVLFLLLTLFVPKFEPIFAKLREQGKLPLLTKALLNFSSFLLSWPGLITGLVIVAAVVLLYVWSRGSGRKTADALRLRLPLFGAIFRNLALSRFARILGTMLTNGIPILKALRIAKDSTGNLVLTEAIEAATENITAGQKLADPLRRSPYFPTEVVEMIAIAEEANTLEKVLINIADNLERRTTRSLELMVKLLEPAMLLVMAVLVGLVAGGLLLPVFKLGEAVR